LLLLIRLVDIYCVQRSEATINSLNKMSTSESIRRGVEANGADQAAMEGETSDNDASANDLRSGASQTETSTDPTAAATITVPLSSSATAAAVATGRVENQVFVIPNCPPTCVPANAAGCPQIVVLPYLPANAQFRQQGGNGPRVIEAWTDLKNIRTFPGTYQLPPHYFEPPPQYNSWQHEGNNNINPSTAIDAAHIINTSSSNCDCFAGQEHVEQLRMVNRAVTYNPACTSIHQQRPVVAPPTPTVANSSFVCGSDGNRQGWQMDKKVK
jgi:hypothetical protein